GLVVDGLGYEAIVRKRLGDDRDIDLALAQELEQLDGEVLLQQQGHLRRARDDLGHQSWPEIRAYGVDDPHPQGTGEWVLALGRDLADRVRLFEHPLRLLDDLHADRGHRDFGAAALEELDPELFLELLDGHRQRRLADETGLRGAAEVALARDRYDVLELCQRHGRSMIARRRNPVAGRPDVLRPGAPA